MSTDRIGPSEHSNAYTPRPVGDRSGGGADPASRRARKKKRKKRAPRPDPESEGPATPDDDDPPHRVDIRAASGPAFRLET